MPQIAHAEEAHHQRAEAEQRRGRSRAGRAAATRMPSSTVMVAAPRRPEAPFGQASPRRRAGDRADVERRQIRQRRASGVAQERRVPEVHRVVDAHERADDERGLDRRADQIALEDARQRDLAGSTIGWPRRLASASIRCRSSHTGLSGHLARIHSVKSAGTSAHPEHGAPGEVGRVARRAGRRTGTRPRPAGSPSTSRRAAGPRRGRAACVGQCSSTSGMPAAHSPPMPRPNSARSANSIA